LLIAGVDEAGRGCVNGPLVISGYLIEEEKIPCLLELGVKDSKKLSRKNRKSILSKIMDLSENSMTIYLSPEQIDKVVKSKRKLHKLNRLEAKTMAKIIEILKPDKAFVDAADVIEDRFKKHIQECLVIKTIINSKHKADELFPVVSAASIIAKVKRDEKIRILRDKYGDFGSGYLSDRKTRLFLKDWIKNNKEYPICVRKSWKPAMQIKNEKGTRQTVLF
jgi:ribonuclease HII